MILTNGMMRPIPFTFGAIKREASQDGMTSIVTAICENGDEISISQHNSGTWDIAINDNPVEEFYQGEVTQAVQHFMRLIREGV